MKRLFFIFAILSFFLSSCLNIDTVTAAPNPLFITPSRPPLILSPTPIIHYPTSSLTLPATTATMTVEATSTFTPFVTETFTPTHTPSAEPLTLQLLGCNAGFDVTHGMGEVTNTYITIANASNLDLTAVCATLTAADEGRFHPDKMVCVPSLPRGYQITLKLTVDTTFQIDTLVDVSVLSNEGLTVFVSGTSCRDIGAFIPPQETIGVLQPIQ